MQQGRLITVAIHTYNKAVALKALLEHEGISVTLQNVNLSSPVVSSGVRVRIFEDDLPLALRIIENPEIFGFTFPLDTPAGCSAVGGNTILVPIDFSNRAMKAAKAAFDMAAHCGDRVVFLHAYIVPRGSSALSVGSSLTFDEGIEQIENVEASVAIAGGAHKQMTKFLSQIKQCVKTGEISPAKFSSVLMEGVPEECIARYLKEHREVRTLVMSTRAAEQKNHDLAGSITAEVLDNCRIQALTVPESDSNFTTLSAVNTVALLSSLEQEDFLALDAMNRLMPQDKKLNIKVICLPNKHYDSATVESARTALREYCAEHFPTYDFSLMPIEKEMPALNNSDIELLVVPNRKKNIFARLFNPGLAHRIIFHTDIPMLVIPV